MQERKLQEEEGGGMGKQKNWIFTKPRQLVPSCIAAGIVPGHFLQSHTRMSGCLGSTCRIVARWVGEPAEVDFSPHP